MNSIGVYTRFTTEQEINSDSFIGFMENLSLYISKETVGRINPQSKRAARLKTVGKDGKKEVSTSAIFINLPADQYRRHPLAILKGKWIEPHHYRNKHGLFYTVKDIISNVGKPYMINFSRPAA